MKIIFYTWIGLLLFSCRLNQEHSSCSTDGLAENRVYIKSRIKTYKTLKISDTSLVVVKGHILGKYKLKDSIFTSPLNAAIVIFVRTSDSLEFTAISDEKGSYSIKLKQGNYDALVKFYGYNAIFIRNFKFLNGMIKNLDVVLGQGEAVDNQRIP